MEVTPTKLLTLNFTVKTKKKYKIGDLVQWNPPDSLMFLYFQEINPLITSLYKEETDFLEVPGNCIKRQIVFLGDDQNIDEKTIITTTMGLVISKSFNYEINGMIGYIHYNRVMIGNNIYWIESNLLIPMEY